VVEWQNGRFNMTNGQQLIARCKDHVLEVMRALPECEALTGSGLGYRAIEKEADFDLGLGAQNGYLTWSLLISLAEEGKVEVVPGTERRRKFRLRRAENT
jgi:hypothetical protein